MKIAVVTDSSSGMTKKEFKQENLFIIPMPFIVNGTGYFEDINMTQKEFYEKLELKDTVVSTSQPSVYCIEDLWENILKDFDKIIHIPLSSGLSATTETAKSLAISPKFNGKVYVIDNKRVSVTLKVSVLDALKMIEDGYSAEEINRYLYDTQADSSIYIMVPNLKYLKRGGRVTAAGAALGTLLNIKPVLQIQGGKLDAYKKVASIEKAKKVMIKALVDDIETRFKDIYEAEELSVNIAHTQNIEEAYEFKNEILEKLPKASVDFIDPLSLVISCHIGPGSLAIGCARKYISKK